MIARPSSEIDSPFAGTHHTAFSLRGRFKEKQQAQPPELEDSTAPDEGLHRSTRELRAEPQ
jgi:hypothetical protein